MSAPEPQRAGRPRTVRIAFAVAFAAALLAAIEGTLALLGLPRDGAATRPPLDLATYEPDAALLWRLRRSTVIDVPVQGFSRMRTNAAGLRGDELPSPPPRAPEDLVVLCLGDSVTNGMNLPEDATYPSRLGAALAAKLPQRRVRVVNAGIPGHSIVQGRRLFDELRALQPDAVVAWYGLNDAKPAMGVPDAAYRMPSAGETPPLLRGLRTFRAIESIVVPSVGEARRATASETADAASHIASAVAADGGVALFVRGPTRLAEKEAQLRRVLGAARGAAASRVEASKFVLLPYVCAVPATERLVATEGGVARFDAAGEPLEEVPVTTLAERLEFVVSWRRHYDEHLAALPPGAIDGAPLLGDLAPAEAFDDCVHFTAAGAASVGTRLADLVAAALQSRPR